ncbi:MAG: YfhO family protein, partial [Oscillospiraceae bacterium]|nr:YfhO family protein [Oscillospiraceae bacterium]
VMDALMGRVSQISPPTIGKDFLEMSVSGVIDESDNLLFLPVAYDSGWAARVNGKPVETREVLGAFVAVPLVEGDNRVVLTFTPRGMREAAMIGFLGTGFFAIVLWLARRGKNSGIAISSHGNALYTTICATVRGIYIVLWLAIVAAVYAIPLAVALVRDFLL